MSRTHAHSARLVGLSDGVRHGGQHVLLYLVPCGGSEPCAVALDLDDARRLQAGLDAILPELLRRREELTEAN